MKYDILHKFRECLEQEPLAPNTRKQYYAFVKKVLGGLEWQTVETINPVQVLAAMSKLKTANDVSAARNGLLLFCKHFPALNLNPPTGSDLHKRNRAKRQWQVLEVNKVKRSINGMHSEGDRLAYRLMLATGMRVSEVAGLYPKDITRIELTADDSGCGQQLVFKLRHTKKGCEDVVTTSDPYLLQRLPEYIRDKPPEQTLFRSCQTLKNTAGAHSFECHDLRRAFASERYAQAKTELGDNRQALDTVKEALRHENDSTTRRYLRRNMIKTNKRQ